MNKPNNVNELFLCELQDMYDAEQQLTKALPKMLEHINSQNLAKCLEQHLTETQQQVQRLEQIFKILGVSAKSKTCEAMKGLIEETKELVNEYSDQSFLDAGLIAMAQKVEHYEIASYGCLCTWCKALNLDNKILELLHKNLEEEKKADQLLTQVAEKEVNAQMFSNQFQKTRA